jgi:surfactin synthase thioesterase subunit
MADLAPMSKVVRPLFRATSEELITKLINAGYLQPALRNDPDCITTAIAHLKEDLRGGGNDGGPGDA